MSAAFRPADDSFWTEVRNRTAGASGPVLFLERWPRAAGRRSWYLLEQPVDVMTTRQLVGPGAGLTAYFEPRFVVFSGTDPTALSSAAALLADMGPNDELLAFRRDDQAPKLNVEYVSDADELSDWLDDMPSGEVWLCKYPAWPPDGPGELTAVVADEDGMVRGHPY